jgi:hypothetical protein
MTERELQEQRREKWRVSGQPIRTLEDARDFIESNGFCLMYPVRPAMLVPTFMGAYAGTDQNIPSWQHAFADPRAKDATDLMVRTLRAKYAYEANSFGESDFLVSAAAFPFFYGLVGDRNPRQAPKVGPRSEYSPLAAHAFQVIQKEGPVTKGRLKELLGGELSSAALDRALGELWAKLRITRVDYRPEEGAFWDVLFRWSPDLVREGMNISLAQAMTALISKYLECVVAAEQAEVEEFFSNFLSRSRAREAIHALLAARELQYVHVGGRAMLQITPPKISTVPLPRVHRQEPVKMQTPPAIVRGQPIAQRPRRKMVPAKPAPPVKPAEKSSTEE